MKKSSNEFYTEGQYLKHNKTWGIEDASWKANVIYKLLKRNNISISDMVDVGCGAGGILEALANKNSNVKTFTGFDIALDAIEIANKKSTGKVKFIHGDYTQNSYPKADLLLMIDVIEHIDDFYGFLRKLKMQSEYFIFHIPLDLCCWSLLRPHILLQQRDAVGHIHYFSKEMVLWFLADIGFTVIDFEYTKPNLDVKPATTFKTFIKKQLRKIAFALNKELSIKIWGGYSMMILLK
jgi:SAM-dependent methyltransferase